jgi:serine protease Do
MARHWIALVALILISPPAAHADELQTLSQSLQDLTSRVSPAVVKIVTSGYGYILEPDGNGGRPAGKQRAGGSGVLVSADGYIITNSHVVAGAKSIHVIFVQPRRTGSSESILKAPGRKVEARLVGLDTETDLAVLKTDVTGLPFLKLGDSDAIQQGQLVVAVGSPMGLENSVTMGVVSSVARQLRPEDRMVYLQTDAPINPGNSGGPLLDMNGDVIGINTLILSQGGGSEGIGFAAPSNIVRHVFDEIRTKGRVRRGHIGVVAQTISPTLADGLRLAQNWGVILGEVMPGSPAASAGLQPGDVIVEMDGKPMENGRQFTVNLYSRRVGSTVRLDVARGEARRTVTVEIVERADDVGLFAHLISTAQNPIHRLGVLAIDINDELVGRVPWLRSRDGVGILARATDAPFGEEGPLSPGDVIEAVNGQPVNNIAALRAMLDGMETGAPIAMLVNRRGTHMWVGLELE